MEAHRVVNRRGSHIFSTVGSQMAVRLPASAVILRFESRGTHDHILLSQIRDSLNLECQVPVFISPRKRVALLYPQALSSLFVASNYSQGYRGVSE
jgi:hypothetical protein